MKKNIMIIIGLIALDQIIKIIISKTIGMSEASIQIIPNLLALTYVENVGAAFGIFSERIFLIGLDILIIFIITKIIVSKKYDLDEKNKYGMLLILSGGIGNLIDRVIRGYVIDYIDISNLFDFPVFNFSDICIIIGVIIVFICVLINTLKKQEERYEIEK